MNVIFLFSTRCTNRLQSSSTINAPVRPFGVPPHGFAFDCSSSQLFPLSARVSQRARSAPLALSSPQLVVFPLGARLVVDMPARCSALRRACWLTACGSCWSARQSAFASSSSLRLVSPALLRSVLEPACDWGGRGDVPREICLQRDDRAQLHIATPRLRSRRGWHRPA